MRPDKKRVEALHQIQTTRNKKHFMQLLGLVNTFNKWVPELSLHEKQLRDLIEKNAYFKWTKEHSEFFKTVKKAIETNIPLEPFSIEDSSIILMDASLTGLGYILIQTTS